jgi:hypothetical protein
MDEQTLHDKLRAGFHTQIHTPEAGKPTISYSTPEPAEPTTPSRRSEGSNLPSREAGDPTTPFKRGGKATTPYKSYRWGEKTEDEKESLKDR